MRSVFPEVLGKPSAATGPFRAVEAAAVPVAAAVAGLVDRLFTWHQRSRDRLALGQLDEHMLHDIGLSRADVDHEVSKPFWQS
jgi:uncharacterized protein YjiS (DUF1127 family)